jgi:hypothetical protein
MAKYGRKPKREPSQKEIRAAEARKQAIKAKAEAKKKTPVKKENWLDRLSPSRAKALIWCGIGVCTAFIITATVILIGIYTVTTRGTKIDWHTERPSHEYMLGIYNDLTRKFGVSTTRVMSEVEAFNYALVDFMLHNTDNATARLRLNQTQTVEMIRGFHRAGEPDEVIEVTINDNGDIIYVTYALTQDGFDITINGETFSADGFSAPDPTFYTVPYGEGFNYLIVCNQFNPGRAVIYYFDGEGTRLAGELPVGILDMNITDHGSIGFRNARSRFQGWEIHDFLVFDDNYNLVPVELHSTGFYDYVLTVSVFTAEDITPRHVGY